MEGSGATSVFYLLWLRARRSGPSVILGGLPASDGGRVPPVRGASGPGEGGAVPGPQPPRGRRRMTTTPMRLALNFQRVDPARGGAETYVADLCRRLVRDGHE